jgi:hypothetical protein
VAPDRVSHSSLAHIQSWQPFEETDAGVTMLMLNGLTDKSGAELLPLARSWLSPPAMEIAAAGFRSEGFDATERAFVVSRAGAVASQPVQITLRASGESPLVNPALVIRNWGLSPARVEIDGQSVPAGKDLRLGSVHRLEGDDLVVWIRKDATAPLRITVAPARPDSAR